MRRALLDLLRCPTTGSTLSLEAVEADGDRVLYGVLLAEATAYPILAGVPVLLPGHEQSVALLRKGRHAQAAAAALWRELAPSRMARVAQALELLRPGISLARALEGLDQRRLLKALTPLLDVAEPDPLALVRFGFEGWGASNPDAVSYFTYRFGTPRYLVSLAAADAAVVESDDLVLDLGCGTGHLSWSLGQKFGDERTIGVDLSLFELWAARGVAGSVEFVCGDATALPFRSGSFGLVISADVLSFVANKWGAAREAARVLTGHGTLAITAVKSSLQEHVYAGMPLTPAGWQRLVSPLPHCLFADDRILARYFAGEGLAVDDPGASIKAKTVTLMAGATDLVLRTPATCDDWPHARGPLGVNPLLQLTGGTDEDLFYRRRFPTERFADDNSPLRDYLPEVVTIPRGAFTGDGLDRGQVEHLVAGTAVLAMPEPYRRASLPHIEPVRAPARRDATAGR